MKIRTIILILALIAFFTAIVGGCLYYFSMSGSALREAHKDADEHIKLLALQLSSYLVEQQKAVSALAGLKEMQQALENRDARTIDSANAILDNFQQALKADVCYLIERDGNTIAASNRSMPDSFLGKNYAFRPYFIQAIQGTPALYMAIGITSQKRGIYYSHPVFGKGQGPLLGVVVLKASTEYIEKLMIGQFDGIISIVDPHGMVFISNRNEWFNHVMWKISPEVISEIAGSQQFGKGPWDWTGMQRRDEDHAVDAAGNKYMIHEYEIAVYPGWKIIYLHDIRMIREKISRPLFNHVGLLILAFCIVIGLTVYFLYNRAGLEIFKRKSAEELMRQERDKAQKYLDVAGVMLTVLDASGRVELINKKGCEILRSTEQDIVGRDWFEHFLPERIRAEVKAVFQRLMAGDIEPVEYYENPVLTRGNRERMVAFHNTILRNQAGNITGVLFSGLDITAKRNLEAEVLKVHKLESIGVLAGGLAHDYNNLLNVILGNISFAKTFVKPEDRIFELLEEAEKASLRASELTQRLITFSAGGKPIRERISLAGLIRGFECPYAEGLNINCEYSVQDDLWMVEADETQIRQVLNSIMLNAFEAMPEGGGIFISAENIVVTPGEGIPLKPGRYIRISVRDEGIGIPAENLTKIYDPYFTTKEMGAQRGLGLGLAVCYSIIKNHEGLITVESRVGSGTAFHIHLPAAVVG